MLMINYNLILGLVFGGPYPGFSAPIGPGETDKAKIVAQHIKV